MALGPRAVGTERLLVQGYQPTPAWSADLTDTLTGEKDYKQRCFASLVTSPGPEYAWRAFDDATQTVAVVLGPAGQEAWIAFHFTTDYIVNRVKITRSTRVFANGFTVEISSDSKSGNDGYWRALGTVTDSGALVNYDFIENTVAGTWVRLRGVLEAIPGGIKDISVYAYEPPPDKKFWVDAAGNPQTDGRLSAVTMQLTPLAAAPASPTAGLAYFDSTMRKLRVWDGVAWQDAW